MNFSRKTKSPCRFPVFSEMETFAKPIHAVLSNYGYDTAQGRSRVGGKPQCKPNLGDQESRHIIAVPLSFAKVSGWGYKVKGM